MTPLDLQSTNTRLGIGSYRFVRDRLGKPIVVVVAFVVWYVLANYVVANPLLLPGPVVVFRDAIDGIVSGGVLIYTLNTLRVLAIAVLIGVAGAFALSIWAVQTRWGRSTLETLASMFNPLPGIALLPLALIWFGLNERSLVFVTVHSVIWAVGINTLSGFLAVPSTLRMVGANLGLRGFSLVWSIYFPSALPHIVSGLKIGWAYGWRAVIAAELVFGASGAHGGLGWYIYTSRFFLKTSNVFVGLAIIVIVGLITDRLFQFLENRTTRRWGISG